ADQSQSRVLVTETRTRLYPLAAGETTIGEAVAALTLATSGSDSDPMLWFGGRLPRRDIVVKSDPTTVRGRPLPPGAPEGFDGAVGKLAVTWSSDRQRTSQDVPVTVALEVRGVGNLPLLHTPRLESDDFDIFAGTVMDSLPAPGSLAPGRRRFQWTLLP